MGRPRVCLRSVTGLSYDGDGVLGQLQIVPIVGLSPGGPKHCMVSIVSLVSRVGGGRPSLRVGGVKRTSFVVAFGGGPNPKLI